MKSFLIIYNIYNVIYTNKKHTLYYIWFQHYKCMVNHLAGYIYTFHNITKLNIDLTFRRNNYREMLV